MSSELRHRWTQAGGTIPDSWKIVTLESLLKDSKSIAVGVMYPGPDTIGGVPLIKVGDIKGGQIPQKPTYCISQETNNEHRRTQLVGDELLITLVGNPGECVVVTPAMAGWNPARAIAVIRLSDPELRVYLKTVLESAAGKHLIDAVLNTTVQKTLNLKDVRQLPIPMPPRESIRSLSAFSEALGDRINLLRETNATLEAIAQALFKSWFVDFDPVQANAGTQAPSLPPEIQALFPATFTDSPQGPIPEGWNVKPIDEVAVKVGMGPFGSNIKVSTFVPTGVPVLNGKNISTALMDDNCENFITEEHSIKLKSSCVTSGDIVITHRGTLGQVALVPDGLKYDEFVVSQSQFYIRCDRTRMVPEWLLYFFRSPFGQQQLLLNTSQVGVPSIARPVSHMRTLKITVPSIDVLECFSSITGDIHKKIVHNRQQAQNLESLRDTLLPRLISGQLRLPEAKQAIAAITD